MCGLVGFSGKADHELLKKITDSIKHRGPDDDGYLETENFSVGHRRLAIIDLTNDLYPITNENGDIFCFLNGEIYNYQALTEELKSLGHKFKTKSDTEVIVHGYEEWGEDVVKNLRGMFVIVIYDKRKDELFIARDRLGIKPLYYSEIDGRIVFASEIKAIFAGFDVSHEPNDESVMRFLLSRVHDIDKGTFFKNVKRLSPGHTMTIDNMGNYRIQKFWEPRFNSAFATNVPDSEFVDGFRNVFEEAVKLHLIADVPVGVTLSGGLDSSGIATLARKHYGEDQKMYAFSAIHPGETINEEKYIDLVVEKTGLESIKVVPNVDTFWEEIDKWFYFQEEPIISGAPYAYYVVMREARKKVTVLLSGQGGDELLAGYIPYFLTYLQSAQDNGKYLTGLREILMGRDLYGKYFFDKVAGMVKKGKTINPRNSLNLNLENVLLEDIVIKDKGSRNLNERLFKDVTTLTTPSLLRYEDKNSMANSLESRVPFFDHQVVEYIFNLPINVKIRNGWNRWIYREAMKGILPEEIRRRRSKVGFTNPEWEWIERKADNFIEIFNSDSFRSRKYWNANKVLEDFTKTLNGELQGDLLYFWRVFAVEMWMRSYVD